jgi:type I restriction-modification system DNA methylase subunit
MALFQSAVLKQFLAGVRDDEIAEAWAAFQAYFHIPEIQENIRIAKEEEFQDGFLTELFVNILGYTKYPSPGFNLRVEQKDEKGSKKSDGALLKDEKVIGIIELKGTDTTDLDKVEEQAFRYKHYHRHAGYVITSNFEKLRFYIDNAVEHEEFNLFELTRERFKLLWLCLAHKNFTAGIPRKIKEASLTKNEQVTKELYKDYSGFKQAIFESMLKHNPEYDKLSLFKKTQKLLDRFLFIFFAEDQQLLPPNSIRRIIQQWQDLRDEYDIDVTLYDRFKKYFGYLNTGHKGKEHEIFPYNGGLFAEDDVLNSITVDDTLLYKHALQLSKYDFASEVDVNILGHIFEHSLNEIEQITAELEGEKVDRTKTRRKRDGVYYTPKYITKYIVENTVGKLCDEKKNELEIVDEEYRPNRQKATKKQLLNQLEAYREWLLGLTICDPACGSGAFLNQALEFLMEEHKYVDELHAKILNQPLVLSSIEESILENNLFGVDINEESVEIAKLSLWLRTAQKGRKLTSLNNNIKCGNSLIDDPDVAGEKAFKWEEEFPSVFEKGGFDVVIGNPPYVRQELVKQFSDYLKSEYQVYSGKADLYTYFYEKAVRILRDKGYLSFISSGKFFEASYGKNLVSFLVSKTTIKEVVNFDDLEVFEGISAYPLIITLNNKAPNIGADFKYCYVPDHDFEVLDEIVHDLPYSEIGLRDFIENDYRFFDKTTSSIFRKVNTDSYYLENINCLPIVGIKTGFNDGFITIEPKSEFVKTYVFGRDLKRYKSPISDNNIIFPYKKVNDTYELVEEMELGSIKNKLEEYRDKLSNRAIIKEGIKKETKKWYEYQQINKNVDFEAEYIVYPNVSLGCNFTISKGNVIDMTGFIIPSRDKMVLALLNSRLTKFIMRKIAITRRGGYQEFKVQYLKQVPLKKISDDKSKIIVSYVNLLFQLNNELEVLEEGFFGLLQTKFDIDKLSKKIENWHELTFKQFLAELKKKKVTLTLKEEAEWMEYFNEQKAKADELKSQIAQTDREIDAMVYELYGLTEEERNIVEGEK